MRHELVEIQPVETDGRIVNSVLVYSGVVKSLGAKTVQAKTVFQRFFQGKSAT